MLLHSKHLHCSGTGLNRFNLMMPFDAYFLSLGAQQAEDPRIQWRKKRETMLCDYLAVAQSDLLVWMIFLVFYHVQLKECQDITIIILGLHLSLVGGVIKTRKVLVTVYFSLFQMWSPSYKLNTQMMMKTLTRSWLMVKLDLLALKEAFINCLAI